MSGPARSRPPASQLNRCTSTAICCPLNPGHAVALLEDDVVTVRPAVGPSDHDAVRCAGRSAAAAPSLPADPAEGVSHGLILYTGAAEWQQHSPKVEAIRDQFEGIKVQLLTGGPLGLFAAAAD